MAQAVREAYEGDANLLNFLTHELIFLHSAKNPVDIKAILHRIHALLFKIKGPLTPESDYSALLIKSLPNSLVSKFLQKMIVICEQFREDQNKLPEGERNVVLIQTTTIIFNFFVAEAEKRLNELKAFLEKQLELSTEKEKNIIQKLLQTVNSESPAYHKLRAFSKHNIDGDFLAYYQKYWNEKAKRLLDNGEFDSPELNEANKYINDSHLKVAFSIFLIVRNMLYRCADCQDEQDFLLRMFAQTQALLKLDVNASDFNEQLLRYEALIEETHSYARKNKNSVVWQRLGQHVLLFIGLIVVAHSIIIATSLLFALILGVGASAGVIAGLALPVFIGVLAGSTVGTVGGIILLCKGPSFFSNKARERVGKARCFLSLGQNIQSEISTHKARQENTEPSLLKKLLDSIAEIEESLKDGIQKIPQEQIDRFYCMVARYVNFMREMAMAKGLSYPDQLAQMIGESEVAQDSCRSSSSLNMLREILSALTASERIMEQYRQLNRLELDQLLSAYKRGNNRSSIQGIDSIHSEEDCGNLQTFFLMQNIAGLSYPSLVLGICSKAKVWNKDDEEIIGRIDDLKKIISIIKQENEERLAKDALPYLAEAHELNFILDVEQCLDDPQLSGENKLLNIRSMIQRFDLQFSSNYYVRQLIETAERAVGLVEKPHEIKYFLEQIYKGFEQAAQSNQVFYFD